MIEIFIGVVDRTKQWGPLIEARLRRITECPFSILAFSHSHQLLDMIEKHPLRVPLVVVADTDAVVPSPEDGLFAQLAPMVCRCVFVYYSANPTAEVLEGLSRVASYKLISRTRGDHVNRLQAIIEGESRVLTESPDWTLIRMYERYVSRTQEPDVSTADDEDLSPLAMLAEMARGSPKGKTYLRAMIPATWEPSGEQGG